MFKMVQNFNIGSNCQFEHRGDMLSNLSLPTLLSTIILKTMHSIESRIEVKANVLILFSFNFSDKVINLIQVYIFFIYLWFSIACFFIYYKLYKNLSKYFLDNNKSSSIGIISLVIECSLRQLITQFFEGRQSKTIDFSHCILDSVYSGGSYFIKFKRKILQAQCGLDISHLFFPQNPLECTQLFQQKVYDNAQLSSFFEGLVQDMLLVYIFFYIFSVILNFLTRIGQGMLDLYQKDEDQKQDKKDETQKKNDKQRKQQQKVVNFVDHHQEKTEMKIKDMIHQLAVLDKQRDIKIVPKKQKSNFAKKEMKDSQINDLIIYLNYLMNQQIIIHKCFISQCQT